MANTAETLESVFARVAQHTPIDAALVTRIHDYERKFVNRNKDHVEFFGSNLIGVNPIKFRPEDQDVWFIDVLNIDEMDLAEGIANVKDIDSNWVRASDPMNISCIWLVHAINASKHLTQAQKRQGMIDTLLIFQYKVLSSFLSRCYKYPADRATMEAAMASLNRKFSLKQAGSWNVLLRERAESFIQENNVHWPRFRRFHDYDVVLVINDIQGRLKKIVIGLNKVFYDMRESGGRIGVSKDIMSIDGTSELLDRTRRSTTFVRYLHSIMDDKRSFVKDELITIICDIQTTAPPKHVKEVLEWMSINHRVNFPHVEPHVKGGYVEHFVDEVLFYTFDLINSKSGLVTNHTGLAPLLAQLRQLYMASRMNDPKLLLTRDMADAITMVAISSRNISVAASVRTAIQLYVVLRTLTMRHYSS